jgi:hypothetical protein
MAVRSQAKTRSRRSAAGGRVTQDAALEEPHAQRLPRAVLFTHLSRQEVKSDKALDAFADQRAPFFTSCLKCRNVSVVFVYSSGGIETYVKALAANEPLQILRVLDEEQRFKNAVQVAIDRSRSALAKKDRSYLEKLYPKFVFVGVHELSTHLDHLRRIDENEGTELVRSLSSDGNFTYDSPKFIEAIIRLARARSKKPDIARDPILRVDADVIVNESAIGRIIAAAAAEETHKFFWFSGCYSGNHRDDPVNEFAVRQHWLVKEEKKGTRIRYALPEKAASFLVDLAEIGATQLPPLDPKAPERDPRLSLAAREVIDKRRNGVSKNRGKPQLISGAGLVASHQAIEMLPPFMNAREMVVWIDDYLKRLLHERLDHIGRNRMERVRGAAMKQDRYPEGMRKEDILFCILDGPGRTSYFKRLLNGCVMEATIENPDGTDGPLALAVKEVVNSDERYESAAKKHEHRGARYSGNLQDDLLNVARVRFDEVMEIWQNADYGDEADLLRTWAKAFTDKEGVCKLVADMGIAYVNLCRLWERHRSAILQLGELEAYWVHES